MVDTTERRRVVMPIVVAVVAGPALGALTAVGQGWLPDTVSSVANSAGSWSLVALLVAMTASRRSVAAPVGSLTLLGLLVGYLLASVASGFGWSNSLLLFWGLAAVVVGPVLGLAAHEVRSGSPITAALGVAVMSGVLIGEGAYGLLFIADTTYPPYWWGSIVVGTGLLGGVVVRRLREARGAAIAVVFTAVVAVAFVVVYSGDLIGLIR